MALSKGAQAALEALAAEIEAASTWHSGPRHNRLRVMAAQARGIADGSIGAEEIEAVAAATTAAPATSVSTEGDKTRNT